MAEQRGTYVVKLPASSGVGMPESPARLAAARRAHGNGSSGSYSSDAGDEAARATAPGTLPTLAEAGDGDEALAQTPAQASRPRLGFTPLTQRIEDLGSPMHLTVESVAQSTKDSLLRAFSPLTLFTPDLTTVAREQRAQAKKAGKKAGKKKTPGKKAGAGSAAASQRKAMASYIRNVLMKQMVDHAMDKGEYIAEARATQARFEERLVEKPVFTFHHMHGLHFAGVKANATCFLPQLARMFFSNDDELLAFDVITGESVFVINVHALSAELYGHANDHIHSLAADESANRVYVFTTDCQLLAFDGVEGARVRTAAFFDMQMLGRMSSSANVLQVDQATSLVYVCDGDVFHVFEPTIVRYVGSIPLRFPPEVIEFRVVDPVVADYRICSRKRLLICSMLTSPTIYVFDSHGGSLVATLSGNKSTCPRIDYFEEHDIVVTAGASTIDPALRVFSLESIPLPEHRDARFTPRPIRTRHEVIAHESPISSLCCLPESDLVVSSAGDNTIRFFNAASKPHSLVEPSRRKFVRVWPGYYDRMDEQETKTNPPFVNCLSIHTDETFTAVKSFRLRGGLQFLVSITPGIVDSDEPRSAIIVWVIGRTLKHVPCNRFDVPIAQTEIREIEQAFLENWRARLAEYGRGVKALVSSGSLESNKNERTYAEIGKFLMQAIAHRATAADRLQEASLTSIYERALRLRHRFMFPFKYRPLVAEKALCAEEVFDLLRRFSHLVPPHRSVDGFCDHVIDASSFAKLDAPLPKAAAQSDAQRKKAELIDPTRFSLILNEMDPLSQSYHGQLELFRLLDSHIRELAAPLGMRRLLHEFRFFSYGSQQATLFHFLRDAEGHSRTLLREIFIGRERGRLLDASGPVPEVADPREASALQARQATTYFQEDRNTRLREYENMEGMVSFAGLDQVKSANVAVLFFNGNKLKEKQIDGHLFTSHLDKFIDLQSKLYLCPSVVRMVGSKKRLVESEVSIDDEFAGLERFVLLERLDDYVSLADVFASRGFLGAGKYVQLVRMWMHQLLLFFQSVKSNGAVCRYLSPRNIFLSKDGAHLKVAGLERFAMLSARDRVVTCVNFAPVDVNDGYVAPEWYTQDFGEHSSAMDVWLLGACVFHMLFGRTPMPPGRAMLDFVTAHELPFARDAHNWNAAFAGLTFSSQFCYDPSDGVARTREETGIGSSGEALLHVLGPHPDAALPFPFHDPDGYEFDGNDLYRLCQLCLRMDPKQRPSIASLLQSTTAHLDPAELILAKHNGRVFMNQRVPHLVVDFELAGLRAAVRANPDNIDALLERLEQLLLGFDELHKEPRTPSRTPTRTASAATTTASSVFDDIPSGRASVASAIIESEVLDECVRWAQLAWSKGDKSMLLRFQSFFERVVEELRHHRSLCAPHVSKILDLILSLLAGEVRALSSSASAAVATDTSGSAKLLAGRSVWTPAYAQATVRWAYEVYTEEGSGAFQYPVVRDFIAQCRAEEGQRMFALHAGAERFVRHQAYYSDVASVIENLQRIVEVGDHKFKHRKSGAMYFQLLLALGNEQKARLLADFRVPERVLPLLDDKFEEVRTEALKLFEEMSKHLASLSPGYQALCAYFHSSAVLRALARAISRPKEQFGNLSSAITTVSNILLTGEESMTANLVRAECIASVGALITDANRVPAAKNMFARAFRVAHPLAVSAVLASPALADRLRRFQLVAPQPFRLSHLDELFDSITNHSVESLQERQLVTFVDMLRLLFTNTRYVLVHEKRTLQQVELLPRCLRYLSTVLKHHWALALAVDLRDEQTVAAAAARTSRVAATSAGAAKQRMDIEHIERVRSVLNAVIDVVELVLRHDANLLLGSGLIQTLLFAYSEELPFAPYTAQPFAETLMRVRELVFSILQHGSPAVLDELVVNGVGLRAVLGVSHDYANLRTAAALKTVDLHQPPSYARERALRMNSLQLLLGLENPEVIRQLVVSDLVADVVGSNVGDMMRFDVRYKRVPEHFIAFNHEFPLRSEAIEVVRMICKQRKRAPAVYLELVRQIKRHDILAHERSRLWGFDDRRLQASVLDLWTSLIGVNDPELNQLFAEQDIAHELLRVQESIASLSTATKEFKALFKRLRSAVGSNHVLSRVVHWGEPAPDDENSGSSSPVPSASLRERYEDMRRRLPVDMMMKGSPQRHVPS